MRYKNIVTNLTADYYDYDDGCFVLVYPKITVLINAAVMLSCRFGDIKRHFSFLLASCFQLRRSFPKIIASN